MTLSFAKDKQEIKALRRYIGELKEELRLTNDAAEKMISILKKFKHFNNDLFAKDIKIEIVSENGKKEIN